MTEVFNRTILDVIRFYADEADLVTAAHIALVFYHRFFSNKEENKVEIYIQRILSSYYKMLQQLQNYSKAIELVKY